MRFALLLILLTKCFIGAAQLNGKYTFRHLDHTDGILHSSVVDINQDDKGFIWILNYGGLQRYDGSRFVNYMEDFTKFSGRLSFAKLYIDTTRKHVNVIKGKMMDRLDLNNHQFSIVSAHQFMDEDTIHPPASFITREGNRMLIGKRGIVYIEKNTNKELTAAINANPAMLPQSNFIYFDSISNQYWTLTSNEIVIADPVKSKLYYSGNEEADHPLFTQLRNLGERPWMIRFLMHDSYHNLWIVRWDHIFFRYNFLTKKLSRYSLKDIYKKNSGTNSDELALQNNAMYEDRQKNLWIATDYLGLLRYSRENDDFEFLTSEEKIRNGIRYNYTIYSIFQDKDDNLWIGTDRGINIFNPYRNYFQSIRHIGGMTNTLPNRDINSVFQKENGEILVATWGGGVSVYDQHWNFIRNIKFEGPHDSNLTWCFVENDDGTIWIGAQKGYIHICDAALNVIKTIQPPEAGYQTIITMTKDQHGNIIMGLHDGRMAVWNKRERKFLPYNEEMDNDHGGFSHAWSVFMDDADRCWVATDYSLKEFDVENRVFKNYYLPGDTAIDVLFQGMEQINDSVLVVGTMFSGIYLFNMNTGHFSRPFNDDHMNKSSAYAFKKDGAGNLWFTTNFNIIKANKDLTAVTKFNLGKHTNTSPFTSNIIYELQDGRWVTNSWAEIICFDPDELIADRTDLKIEISSFKIFGQNIHIDSLMENQQTLVLPYNKNFFSIEFATLNFTDVRQTSFYYRLSDVDDDWNRTDSKAFADYTDIKPGEYVFQVKAGDGDSYSEMVSLPIVITPPWWGTVWFRILSIIAIAAIVYLFVKHRIKTIRKESDLKHQIAQTEMMALRSQMNPHFIFNCINGIDGMIQSNDKYRATVYLNKFAKLIRNVLDQSKQNKVPLSKDMETLQLYVDLELFRHPGKFTATIQADDELIQNDYTVPPLIIQPYVENAILHGLRHKPGNEGKLKVSVTKSNEHIIYVIEDNGTGRKKMNGNAQHQEGYGMQIGNDRVRLFNNEDIASVDVTDLETDGQPSGTRVQVNLKIR